MAEKEFTMDEVEAELEKIRNKNKDRKQSDEQYCNKDNLDKCLKHLDQELEYFDVSYLTEDLNVKSVSSLRNVLAQLINSTFDLISLHRDSLAKQEEMVEKNCRLATDVKSLKKNVEILKKDLINKERQIEITKEKNCLEKINNRELKTKISLANKEINIIQKENRANKVKYKHEVKKIEEENKRLETRFRKDCGQYVSRDENTIALINNYKANEVKFKDTISKLQESNNEMIEEMMELREKLAEMDYIVYGTTDV